VLETFVKAASVMIPMFLWSIFSSHLCRSLPDDPAAERSFELSYMADCRCACCVNDYLGPAEPFRNGMEKRLRASCKNAGFQTKNPPAGLAALREIAETEGTRVAESLNNRRTIYLADIG